MSRLPMPAAPAPLASLLLLVACDAGGQSGEENVAWGCEVVSETPIAADEVTPDGLTAQDAAALVTPFSGPLTWVEHPATTLDLTPTVDVGSARFVDYELPEVGEGPEPALECVDTIEMDADLAFVTADGLLDELWSIVLVARDASTTDADAEIDPAALAGTYTVTEVDPADYDVVRMFVNPVWTSTAVSGRLTGQAETTGDASDPDSTASATFFDIAIW